MQKYILGLLVLALMACTTTNSGGPALDPPSNVLANANSTTEVQITWDASPSSNLSQYAIERAIAGTTTFQKVGTTAQTSLKDTGATSGRIYTYRVRAEGSGSPSDWDDSNAVALPAACASRSGNLTSEASSKGCFGGVVNNWPVVPTFSSLLPTGNVISWYASDEVGKYRERTDVHNLNPRIQAGLGTQDGTLVAVWNPSSGTFGDASFGQRDNTSATVTKATDLFCAGYTVLGDGKFFTAGGNVGLTYGSIRLNIFNPITQSWENGPGPSTPNMWRDRWYPTVTKLPDGRVFISGGTAARDTAFKDGISDKETALGDSSRAGQNICRTSSGICPPGLEGTIGGIAPSGAANLPPGTPANSVFSVFYGIKGDGNPANTGYNNSFEIYNPTDGSLSMLGTTAREVPTFEHYYPQFFVAPSGLLYLAGASRQRGFLNQSKSTGTPASYWSDIQTTGGQRTYSSAVMYEPGKILVTGGGYAFIDSGVVGYGQTADNNVPIKISLSANSASIANNGPNMNFRRTHHNSTVLADGRVFINGGQQNGGETSPNPNGSLPAGLPWARTVNPETIWNLDLGVKTSEIWNPTSATFAVAAKADQERMYHSVAMLLPDATVLTAGGGGCGVCADKSLAPGVYGSLDASSPASRGDSSDTKLTQRQKSTNKLNHEIYYPPYLFKADGSLAPRPIITGLVAATVNGYPTISYDKTFDLTWVHPEAGHTIPKVTFLALGAPTHAFNQNQRYLELPIQSSTGNTLKVTAPSAGQYGSSSGRNIAPPGFYMVFILDDKGVPSLAKIVNLQ